MARENSSMSTAAAIDLPSGLDDCSILDYSHGGFQGCAKKLLFVGHNTTASFLE